MSGLEKAGVWALFVILLGVVGFALWFASHYDCARQHEEQRLSCMSVGFGQDLHVTSTDCRPYTEMVCDEWRRR